MRYLEITEGMKGDEESELYKLCKFLGMDEVTIKNEMFYFTNGEGFNWEGFTTSDSSETETILQEGGVLLERGESYQYLPAKYSWLLWGLDVAESRADNLEDTLHQIYEMGSLNKFGVEIYKRAFDK